MCKQLAEIQNRKHLIVIHVNKHITHSWAIDHFAGVYLVAWPLNESKAGGDLVLIETSNKTRSTPASLSFKGQATKHTTVKC